MRVILVWLLLFPVIASAQETMVERMKPVLCADFGWLVKTLSEKYGEKPVIFGSTDNGQDRAVLLVNPSTGTWSFLEYGKRVGCLISSGTDYNQPVSSILDYSTR